MCTTKKKDTKYGISKTNNILLTAEKPEKAKKITWRMKCDEHKKITTGARDTAGKWYIRNKIKEIEKVMEG